MNKTIDQLPEKSAVEVNDEFIVFDPSDGVTKKVKGSNMQVPFQYSTTEQFTGRYWTDGKPIYIRVFDVNVPVSANQWYNSTVSIPNISTLINANGRGVDLNASFPDTIYNGLVFAIADNTTDLYFYSPYIGTIKRIYVEYTKTTD